MPIRALGTYDHEHFEAIFETVRDLVEAMGMECIRADESLLPGNISKVIIQQLAESDLVITDLSDLNPNVFYELGLRHTFRRNGTILMMDRSRSAEIPFDLSQYRVLLYEGTVPGVRSLTNDLKATIAALFDSAPPNPDSPVHDWLPELPSDIVAHGRATTDASLRSELAEARLQLEMYRARYSDAPIELAGTSAIELIQILQRAAASKELPLQVLEAAEASAQELDVTAFLKATERYLTAGVDVTPDGLNRLSLRAASLGLAGLAESILVDAVSRFPLNDKLQQSLLVRLSRSASPDTRTRAKEELARRAGVDLETMQFVEGADPSNTLTEIGFLLELLHEEKNDEVGLTLIDAALKSSSSLVLRRNHARQLGWVGQSENAILAYKNMLMSPVIDQECIHWFGSDLHNAGLHVMAAEVYLLEGYFDVDDSSGFLHAAGDLAFALFEPFAFAAERAASPYATDRDVPDNIDQETIAQALNMAVSCPQFDLTEQRQVLATSTRAGLDASKLSQRPLVDKLSRIAWLQSTYKYLESDLTRDCPIGVRLLSEPGR